MKKPRGAKSSSISTTSKTKPADPFRFLVRYKPTTESPAVGETLDWIARPEGMPKEEWRQLAREDRLRYVKAWNEAADRRVLEDRFSAAEERLRREGGAGAATGEPVLVSEDRWHFLHRLAAAIQGLHMYAGIAAHKFEKAIPMLQEFAQSLSSQDSFVPTARKDGVLPPAGAPLRSVAVHRLPAGVPQLDLPRKELEEIIRALRYLLDKSASFERFHREQRPDGCLECGKKLPPGKRKYCSRKCTDNYLQDRHRSRLKDEEQEKADREKYRVTMGTPEEPQVITPGKWMRPPMDDAPPPRRRQYKRKV